MRLNATVGVVLMGALLGAPPSVAAQDRIVGFTYTPAVSLHDESTCCSAAGVWLTVGRLQVEHVFASDSRNTRRHPATVDGHLTTALWTARAWRARRFDTRFQVGGRYGTTSIPTAYTFGLGVALTVDYRAGSTVLRGAVHALFPRPPELRVGVGWMF